jgi:uncharacterized protein YgbK (DUF1537 family)
LDDDATGTQTVHGVPVALDWSVPTLMELLATSDRVAYVLTNSRSQDAAGAARVTHEVVIAVSTAAQKLGLDIQFVSRSDSTLRGHFPVETMAAMEAASSVLGYVFSGQVLIPAFIEAGRLTVDRTHWVEGNGVFTPVGLTEYARDRTLGYSASDLAEWVEEKSGGTIPSCQVVWVSLATIRNGGTTAVQDVVERAPRDATIVCDAAAYADLEILACAFLAQEERGRRYIYRTAASWIPVYGGIPRRHTLRITEVTEGVRSTSAGGLIVIGSHSSASTRQLSRLLEDEGVVGIEFSIPRLQKDTPGKDIPRYVELIESAMSQGYDAVLYTTRDVTTGDDDVAYRELGANIMAALVQIVAMLTVTPRFLLAKGGITASRLARAALGCNLAEVIGQVQPGVTVWRIDHSPHLAGTPYVVYPGNVGPDTGLAEVVRLFRPAKLC